ncbi:hypothetical protein Tco_0001092, partial [Tanacetum coccineum]
VMSTDSAVTYTSVHSKARSWSIPSEDPYEEDARQLMEKEHLPDLDEAPTEGILIEVASAPHLPPSFLPSLIRPPCIRAAIAQMRAAASSTYHPLLPARTPPLLPIPLPTPSTSRRADIPEDDMPPRKRLLLTAPGPGCEVGERSVVTATRQPGPTMARRVDCSSVETVETRVRDTKRRMMAALEVVNMRKDHAAVRAEIKVLRRERLAYEQESMETPQALARSEAYSRALEAHVTVLETQARCHEWQRLDVNDHATRHIIRIQALEAGVRDDTLEDTGSSAQAVMSADSTVTYTSVHSEARSWSIPSENPYKEAARKLLEQAPHSPEYVPDPMELEDHVPVYIPEPEHPEDLVPAEDEAPIEAYITEVAFAPPPPPSFLPSLIRPPRTRAAIAQMRAATSSTYHPLLPSGTPPLLPIPLPTPSTSRIADILEADMPPRKRLLLTAPRPGCEVGESSAAAAARQP